MKTKRANKAATGILKTIFLLVIDAFSLFKVSILAFFHFGILTQKVYKPLSGEYIRMRGCGVWQ